MKSAYYSYAPAVPHAEHKPGSLRGRTLHSLSNANDCTYDGLYTVLSGPKDGKVFVRLERSPCAPHWVPLSQFDITPATLSKSALAAIEDDEARERARPSYHRGLSPASRECWGLE